MKTKDLNADLSVEDLDKIIQYFKNENLDADHLIIKRDAMVEARKALKKSRPKETKSSHLSPQ